ncbi:uncharacterized protein BCR38DRAFT_477626 [Pseudomassariella vexata]|uniref:Uncharacterized protein n=1 Tax=Pseudomassariella vexata TaxID=1141098 RepID=A0A1Y2DHS1_9PEZI|nr:uncharacterized protein BCR38DRAFT_477626 [Pseudomassariella vexata]ORY58787.1 hypothetical protein BCR38DRAFT_477626 [Pseudomassariella vexata]
MHSSSGRLRCDQASNLCCLLDRDHVEFQSARGLATAPPGCMVGLMAPPIFRSNTSRRPAHSFIGQSCVSNIRNAVALLLSSSGAYTKFRFDYLHIHNTIDYPMSGSIEGGGSQMQTARIHSKYIVNPTKLSAVLREQLGDGTYEVEMRQNIYNIKSQSGIDMYAFQRIRTILTQSKTS